MGAELDILIWIQEELRSSAADILMVSVSAVADYGLVFALIGAVLLVSKRYRWIGAAVIIGWLAAEFADTALKYLVDRPRPFEIYPIELLIPVPVSPSFPSTHSAVAVMAATVFCLFKRYRAAVIAGAFAILMMFSRLYLFVHYPTDVLGGAAMGVLCGLLAYYAVRWLKERFPDSVAI